MGFQNAGRAAPDSPGNSPLELSSYGGVDLQATNIPSQAPAQAQIERDPRVISFPARPRRRHVPPPRRLEVRITAADGRSPIGRSRPFRLSDHALDALIMHAGKLEAGK
jgi:hypothetical protein